MECSSPRFLQSQNSSIVVIIRDSFGKTVAAMNKILPSAYTAEATEAFALQQGGSCLLLKWKSPMLSLDQTPSPSSNPWTQAKTAAKSGMSSRTSEHQSFPSCWCLFQHLRKGWQQSCPWTSQRSKAFGPLQSVEGGHPSPNPACLT